MYGPQYGDGAPLYSLNLYLLHLFILGTFYAVGLGACGNTNTDDEHVVAVSIDLYTAYPSVLFLPPIPPSSLSHRGYNGVNPNTNPVCGKVITASCNYLFFLLHRFDLLSLFRPRCIGRCYCRGRL